MESTSSENQTNENPHMIFYKDKYGVHFIQPFKDKNIKLLSVDNASIIVNSGILIAVINYIKI